MRRRSEGGERLTRRLIREEDEVQFENARMPGIWMKNKRIQVEMTRQATMRAEERRQGSRRSGKRPKLEGRWENAGQREGVRVVKWSELSKTQKNNRRRRAEGKDNRKRSHAQRRAGRTESQGGNEGGRRRIEKTITIIDL